MQAVLFHDFNKVPSYYGNVPNGPYDPMHHVELYRMRESDRDPMDEDFTDPVNEVCGTTLGYGDVDFLNPTQCRLLTGWLEARLTRPITPRLATIYRHLLDYAQRAIQYNTGIVIEL